MLTWDESKRLANLDKHGMDFASVDDAFFLGAKVVVAKADRYKAIGPMGGRLVSLIFKPLGAEAISLISLRPAGKAERKLFDG